MEISKEKEIFIHSNIQLSMDYDISMNNINNFTLNNESVLDLSLTSNSNENFSQYNRTNSYIPYELTNCTTIYSKISDLKNYYSIEKTFETISSNHCTHNDSIHNTDNIALNSGNYIPNIPTPEQLLMLTEDTSYSLHGKLSVRSYFREWNIYTWIHFFFISYSPTVNVFLILTGQINFVNLFRQAWHYYQQYLIQPNYSFHTTYLPTDDYQCYVHNNQPMFNSSQPSNTLISQYNATHYHINDSECPSKSSIHLIPDTKENNIPISNYSTSAISTDKNDKITSNGSESPGDKPRQYRKARAYFHPKQMNCLESFFQKNPYLSTRDREYLSRKLNLSEDRIRTWFQNRRMREKRKPGINYDSDNSSMNSIAKIDYS
ncbi:unnamed protein product [Schistosoma margrebowiei]|uniref:Uncharacterized protein n=1 Tax=Schistosoma margrebowiei TaxID=48269 RepID=A0A183MLF1_9TREM|nr:unnamed protein product [Schistosoma margrebowiei]